MNNIHRIFSVLVLIFITACQAKPSDTPPILPNKTISSAAPSLALTATSEPISTNTPSPTTSLIHLHTATPSSLDRCEVNGAIELAQMTIAFVADWDGDYEIFLIQADGSDLRQLTFNEAMETRPQWSPDGEWIAYAAGGGIHNLKLYAIHPNGSERVLLAPDRRITLVGLGWSPDSTMVAVESLGEIIAVHLHDGSWTSLTSGENFAPASPSWSPDGQKLVFMANIAGRSLIWRLFTVLIDGSDLKQIDYDLGIALSPMWHPMNDEILFVSSVQSRGDDVYRINADGSQLYMLTDTGSVSKDNAMWSPNGQMVAYKAINWEILDDYNSFVQASIHVMNYDGSNDTIIVQGPEEEEFVIDSFSWAPDNRHIAFIARNRSGEGVPSNLYLVDICDPEVQLIAEVVVGYAPSWKP